MKRLALLPIVFLSLGAPSLARADGADLIEAKKRMAEGRALFLKEHFDESRQLFVKACAVVHTDNCIRSLALAELRAGKWLDSYRHWKEYFASPTAFVTIDAAGRKDLEGFKREAYERTAHVQVVAPAGAHVFLDGAEVGVAPLATEIDLLPADHLLEVTLDDRRGRAPVTPVAGQTTTVTLALEASAAPPVPTAVPAPPAPTSAPTTEVSPQPPADVHRGHVSTAGTVTRWTLTGVSAV